MPDTDRGSGMSQVTKLVLLRVWLSEHREALGLIPAAAVTVAVVAVLLSLGGGPTLPATGRIEQEHYSESDTGGSPVAIVRVPEGLTNVYLSRVNTCRVGDTIQLRRRQLPWGPYYTAAINPCPLARRRG